MLFTQTAITLAAAVIISSFVALSLSPMLASKFLKQNMNKSKIVLKFEKFLKNLTYLYKVSLLGWIKKRTTITIFLLVTLALTLFFFNFTKKELIAPEDRGAFFVIVKAPQGSGFNFSNYNYLPFFGKYKSSRGSSGSFTCFINFNFFSNLYF